MVNAIGQQAVNLQPMAPRATSNGNAAAENPDTINWTFEFDPRSLPGVKNPVVKGSFNADTGLYDSQWNKLQGTPMQENKGVYTAKIPLKWGQDQKFEWRVEGELHGKQQSLVLSDDQLSFHTWDPAAKSSYAPISNHLYGVHKSAEGDVQFRTWAPAMGEGPNQGYKLNLDLYGQDGKLQKSIPMEKDLVRGGDWAVTLPDWKGLEGCSYRYTARNDKGEALKTADGQLVSYADPVPVSCRVSSAASSASSWNPCWDLKPAGMTTPGRAAPTTKTIPNGAVSPSTAIPTPSR